MTWTIEPNLVLPNWHDRQPASPFLDAACVFLQNTGLKTVVLSQMESLLGRNALINYHLFNAAETGMHVVKMGFKVICDTDDRIRAAQRGGSRESLPVCVTGTLRGDHWSH